MTSLLAAGLHLGLGPPAHGASAAGFSTHVSTLSDAQRRAMVGVSWRPGCPVGLGALRAVSLTYVGFDHRSHQGTLILNADAVTAVVGAFRALFRAHFPIRRMAPVEAYGGSDERSMAADNTSGFNCRRVPGTTVWSQHAYGRAVDLDPLENPEVSGTLVDPPSARRFANRTLHLPGMIYHGGTAWRAFAAQGWHWGGDWRSPRDYQHFSATGL